MQRLSVAIWFLFRISLYARLLNAALFGMYLAETGLRFRSGERSVTTP
jgi:hypothetical protein